MRVVSIRRYPVKAMGGEDLDHVEVDRRGLAGDRWYAVVDAEGRLAAGKDTRRFRRRDAVFDFAARTTGAGVRVRGRGVDLLAGEPELDRLLSAAMGAEVRVLRETDTSHFDDGPVSLVGTASLAWCREHLGVDAQQRRVRANLLVGTTEPFVEESWVGQEVRIGAATLHITDRLVRCRVLDLAQDGVPTTGLLKALGERRDLRLAVHAGVQQPGTVHVGDEVQAPTAS